MRTLLPHPLRARWIPAAFVAVALVPGRADAQLGATANELTQKFTPLAEAFRPTGAERTLEYVVPGMSGRTVQFGFVNGRVEVIVCRGFAELEKVESVLNEAVPAPQTAGGPKPR